MGKGNSGHQKVDHGGDFIQIPRRVLRSPAYLSLSCRARSALLVVLDGFTGFNNGKIGLSIKNLGAALGNQNDGANSRAIAELIEHGLLECMSDASHVKSRAREYRVTFIASKAGAATNEWRGWTAGNGKKIGAEATAARKRKRAEATAAHIGNQYIPPAAVDLDAGNSFQSIDELRTALNAFLATGAASAADVCRAIDLPGGTMSKFRNGRGLPEAFRGPLHWELGKRGALSSDAAGNVHGHPRNNFGGGSEPFPQKGETVPHSGPLEKIGRCVGSPILIDPALPSPPWRRILTPEVTRYAPLLQPGAAA